MSWCNVHFVSVLLQKKAVICHFGEMFWSGMLRSLYDCQANFPRLNLAWMDHPSVFCQWAPRCFHHEHQVEQLCSCAVGVCVTGPALAFIANKYVSACSSFCNWYNLENGSFWLLEKRCISTGIMNRSLTCYLLVLTVCPLLTFCLCKHMTNIAYIACFFVLRSLWHQSRSNHCIQA